jgi:hypothetical protein
MLKLFANLEIASLLYKSDTRNLSNECRSLFRDVNVLDPNLSDDQIKCIFFTPIEYKKVTVLGNRAFKTTEQCLILKKKLQGMLGEEELNEPLSIYNRYRYFID